MKRILIFTLSILISTIPAFAIDYPCVGYCYGNFVNLMDKPQIKDSKIVGKVNEGDMLILLDEATKENEKWYRIESPVDDGTAWILGENVELEDKYFSRSPNFKFVIQVFQDFGLCADKTRAIFGEPQRDLYSEATGMEILEYSNFTVNFIHDTLSKIEITGTKDGLNFGDVKVGSSAEKLFDTFGEPDERINDFWRYIVNERDSFEFYLNNKSEITKMIYTLGD